MGSEYYAKQTKFGQWVVCRGERSRVGIKTKQLHVVFFSPTDLCSVFFQKKVFTLFWYKKVVDYHVKGGLNGEP